jgi:DNA-binding winged helix-turn-helix (wHTH) protein
MKTSLSVVSAQPKAPLERPSPREQPEVISFQPFRIDLAEERLWKGEQELRLRRKPFELLRYLAQNPNRLIRHSELVDAVWGRIAVSESLVRTHVHDLRRVLGEAVIETVVGRGYRFVAKVEARARHLELVRTTQPAPTGDERDPEHPLSNLAHRRVLEQLADALESLGTTDVVVLIVQTRPVSA